MTNGLRYKPRHYSFQWMIDMLSVCRGRPMCPPGRRMRRPYDDIRVFRSKFLESARHIPPFEKGRLWRICLLVLLLVGSLYSFSPLHAQQPLDIARGQMHSGRTAEARRLVEPELAGGSELARLLDAVLTARGDSAALLLEKIAREGGHGQASFQAAERMGDILFTASRWEDAAKWWEYSASITADPADRQRLAIKSARAEYANGRDKQALDKLSGVAKSATMPLAGEARFWRGVVLERQGKTRDAAEEYLAAYSSPVNRLSLAALQRLYAFYGSSGGKNASDWRERWSRASAGTVFDSRYLPSAAPADVSTASGWVIQLGAFSTRQRATDHAARIGRLGLMPVIEPPAADKLYRVRIEGVPSQKELNRITALLKKNKFEFHVIQPGN